MNQTTRKRSKQICCFGTRNGGSVLIPSLSGVPSRSIWQATFEPITRSMCGPPDRGSLVTRAFVSPMDNLLSTLKQYNDNSKINGVLYVHDDMLVNTTHIFGGSGSTKSQGTGTSEDRTRTIYATHHLRTSFRIHPSSSSTANDGNSVSSTNLYYSPPDGFRSDNSTELLERLKPWPHNWICMDTFSKVAKDPRSRPFLEHDDTNGGDPFLLVRGPSQSDFFYVPTRLAEEYEAIAQLLIDHDVFLECGLPRITDILLGMPLSSPLRQQKNQTLNNQKEVLPKIPSTM